MNPQKLIFIITKYHNKTYQYYLKMTYGSYVGIEYKDSFFCIYQRYHAITNYIKWVVQNFYQIRTEIDDNELRLLADYKHYDESNLPKHNDSCFIMNINDHENVTWRDYGLRPLEIYEDWRGVLADISEYDHISYNNSLTPEYALKYLDSSYERYLESIANKKYDEEQKKKQEQEYEEQEEYEDQDMQCEEEPEQVTIHTNEESGRINLGFDEVERIMYMGKANYDIKPTFEIDRNALKSLCGEDPISARDLISNVSETTVVDSEVKQNVKNLIENIDIESNLNVQELDLSSSDSESDDVLEFSGEPVKF